MNHVRVLDCTLRDGGYCNQWTFGKRNIKTICNNLVESGIDIIECGFLTHKGQYDPDVSRYTHPEQAIQFIPKHSGRSHMVLMMNYGEYDLKQLPHKTELGIDGIRVAFHKKDMNEALEQCVMIQDKGYDLYIQPMVSLNYSDEEFLELIRIVNDIGPRAFYIVDSFGMMKTKDLVRLFYMVEHNLRKNICIGFHSHNNMQLSFSNAQTLVGIQTDRELIIDSSVYGMGRGAGNLNTELFVEYLNDTVGSDYLLKPLLTLIDEVLERFHQQTFWGYTLSNYLSAKYNAHPNYAAYLDDRHTLTVENIDEIFSMMDRDKRVLYDREYIEKLYEDYMESGEAQEDHYEALKDQVSGREILAIAPGKSSIDELDTIRQVAEKDNIVVVSVNFDYREVKTDLIFLSNLRRYKELDPNVHSKCIVTSNIPAIDTYVKVRYRDLTNNIEVVRDNAGLMLIKLMIKMNASKILLAGFDGYSADEDQNYAERDRAFYMSRARYEAMNDGMNQALREYAKLVPLELVTQERHICIKA